MGEIPKNFEGNWVWFECVWGRMPSKKIDNLNLARALARNRVRPGVVATTGRPVFMSVVTPASREATVREPAAGVRVRPATATATGVRVHPAATTATGVRVHPAATTATGVRVRPAATTATGVRVRPAATTTATTTPVAVRPQVSVAPVTAATIRNRAHLTALSNPVLAASLAELRPVLTLDNAADEIGYLREKAALPVSEDSAPSDVTLFEAAQDKNSKFYLPRYRIHEGSGRYDMVVAASPDGGWRLRIGLEGFPAPELGPRANGAAELDHQIAVFIRFRAGPSGGIEKRIDFTEIEELDDGRVMVSVGLTLSERDVLLHAVQSPESGVQLVIRRAADVAVRIPKAVNTKKANVLVASKLHDRVTLNTALVTRIAERPMALELGSRMNLNAVTAAGSPRRGRPRRPQPEKPRYETRAIALDDVADPDPLILNPSLHSYFYDAISGGGAGTAASFRRIVRPHPEGQSGARFHAYFQDQSEPWIFYYLPDRFRLARRDTSPFFPQMVVRIASPDGKLETATVSVDYVMEPSVDADRLAAAIPTLQSEVPSAIGADREIVLRPLQARARLKLWLPGPGGAMLQEMDDLDIDLANGFLHSITLPTDGFQEAYAAAYSRDATTLFTGQVLVDTGLSSSDQIPCGIRFADTEGEALDVIEEANGDIVRLRIRNAIESPVRIAGFPVTLHREDTQVDGQLVEGQMEFPIELLPGEELSVSFGPVGVLAGTGPADAVFDTDDVEILPDPDSILPAISDTSVPAHYVREVEVMTMPELLGDATDADSVLLINVEFRGGGDARVTRDAPNANAQVTLPLADLLLGRDVEGRYAFKQQIVRRNGARHEDTEWREADFGLLVVPVL